MSSFDHPNLIQQIGQQMTRLRKAQPEGGGPALMYASETLAAWEAFEPVTA